jgi:D-alanyl-D-alanine carboxypeptidase (penicillin-binding protein 5/6)
MNIKKLTLICAFFIGASLVPIPRAAANPVYQDLPEVDIQSRSAILVHAQTDEILFSHNIHIRREPASLTKVLTALLALEHGRPDDIITAEEDDFSDIIPGAVSAGIVPGEEMTLSDLIYCAMLISANDACNIIARHIAGSAGAFIEMMNLRLAEIGAENTRFVNTHGLPDDNHFSTAYDLYLIAKEALRNPRLMEIANTERIVLSGTNKKPDGRVLTTTNDLITRRRRAEYIYPHARGIKTGRTAAAGHCLMSAAELEGITFISVVLGSFIDEETNFIRSFTETRDLFEWGFANFTVKPILNRVNKLMAVPVIQGMEHDEIYLVPERTVEALVPRHINAEDIDRRINLHEPYMTEGIRAPVRQGDVLGEVILTYQGRHFGTIPLLADKNVERDTLEQIQTRIGIILSSRWFIWGMLGFIGLAGIFTLWTIYYNRRRRRRNMRSGNYRGRKRY